MSFLKKLGQVFIKGVALFTGFLPLLSGVIPQRDAAKIADIADDLTKVAGMVATVEAIAQAASSPIAGAEKAKMVAPLVAQVILQSDIMVGKKIKDHVLFQQGCANVGGGMADILNSLED